MPTVTITVANRPWVKAEFFVVTIVTTLIEPSFQAATHQTSEAKNKAE
jgi:hypothetical protein